MEEKNERIKAILDSTAKALEAEGVKYFLGAVDRDPTAPDGGKAFAQSDVKGEDFAVILNIALPTNADLVNLGIWVGQIMQARNAQRVVTAGKRKPKKVTAKKAVKTEPSIKQRLTK